MSDIHATAAELGLGPDDLVLYGHDKAKIRLSAFQEKPRRARLVLVSAINPTKAGEGKTTTSIGLADALRAAGQRTAVALREPSMGPCFGIKGGGTGGGASQLTPATDINLHFTGDLHAVSAAHNLLAALVDNALHHHIRPPLDPHRVTWRRVLDIGDRALRNLVTGLGGRRNGIPREAGFDITAASEVMAVLCLANDPDDLRARLTRMVVGADPDGEPVTAGDVGGVGAMCALLRDALQPNLVRTLSGTPALVHGGPFANIAHGTNSLLADRAGLALADVLVTEAGFGFDLGGVKFFDLLGRAGDLTPDCVVLVASVRALELHGGVDPRELSGSNVEAVKRGVANLDAHLDAARAFGRPVVVAVNQFPDDHPDALQAVLDHCEGRGVPAVIANPYTGDCAALAERVLATERATAPHPALYSVDEPVRDKIAAVARRACGARGIRFEQPALRDLARIERQGYADLPVCLAKTHRSLSDDPHKLGRPTDFDVRVSGIRVSAGAGFLVVSTGRMLMMPGLPRAPRALEIDVDAEGTISGVG